MTGNDHDIDTPPHKRLSTWLTAPAVWIMGWVAAMAATTRFPDPWRGRVAFLLWGVASAGAVGALIWWAIDSLSRRRTDETEAAFRLRKRNAAVAWAVLGLVVLFFVATLTRLGGNALNRQ
jgi:hypothetical protein